MIESALLFNNEQYILEGDTLTCKKDKDGFRIKIKFSTDQKEIDESIKIVSEFFTREIL